MPTQSHSTCKYSQQNLSKLNVACIKKDNILFSNWVYFGNAVFFTVRESIKVTHHINISKETILWSPGKMQEEQRIK